MSFLLAVQSYPGANHRIDAHFPYYENAGADKILGIGTTDSLTKWPTGVEHVEIGENRYIDNTHLPKRLMDTMRLLLLLPYDRFAIIEWDCLFFKPLPEFTGMASFHAGNRSAGMRAEKYYHVPWCFDWDAGMNFLTKADELLAEANGHEASPDVFFGWVCQEARIEVQQLWLQFTRNTIESAEDAELARQAYRDGAVCIHGIKSRNTLDHILS